MSVANGELANQTTFNTSFMSREVDDNTIGRKDFQNTLPVSGPNVDNIQKVVNSIASALGMTTTQVYNYLFTWTADYVGSSNDTVKERIDALILKFAGATGHAHTGVDGDGQRVSAAQLVDINYLKAVYQATSFIGATGTSMNVSASFTTKAPGGTSTTEGVATTAPNNRCYVMDTDTETYVEDPEGDRVYGLLTEAAGVWTLSFYTNEAGTETPYNLPSTDITIFFQEVFTLETLPTFSPSPADFGSLDVTADVADATPSVPGKVNIGTQSFGGDKTFVDLVSLQGSLRYGLAVDSTTTGAAQSISPTRIIHVLTNISLTSINNIANPAEGKMHVIVNKTGAAIKITNNSGGTAANRIDTGLGYDLYVQPNGCFTAIYNSNQSRWNIVGAQIVGLVSQAAQSIAAAGIISLLQVPREVVYIQGSGGPQTANASTPFPNGTIPNQELEVIGLDNTNTVTVLFGGNVHSNGDVEFRQYTSRKYIWYSTNSVWIEVAKRDS